MEPAPALARSRELPLPHTSALVSSLHQSVSALLRTVGETLVMPHFGMLQATDIAEKTPGEIVTRVDREAEMRLAEGLAAWGLDARIVGEEAAAADPTLLDDAGSGLIWFIDPLDGTAHYAAGRAPFGIMVALVEDGVPLGGWIFDPVSQRLCHAIKGAGAWIDDRLVRVPDSRRDRPVAALATQFMPPAMRLTVHEDAAQVFDLVPIPRCAAAHYPRLCLGENDIALFQRTLPWDHAAGALLLTEAGGAVIRWDGSPYRIGDGKAGILAASHPASLDRAAALLLDGRAGLSAWKGPIQ